MHSCAVHNVRTWNAVRSFSIVRDWDSLRAILFAPHLLRSDLSTWRRLFISETNACPPPSVIVPAARPDTCKAYEEHKIMH